MASKLPEEEKKEIQELFNLFDQDGSGSVSCDELAKIVRGLGHNPTEQELQEMFRILDTDGSGRLDLNEFTVYYANNIYNPHKNTEDELRSAFATFDQDGNGYIDAKELHKILKNMGDNTLSDAEVKQMIKEFDVDKDGKLNYQEFASVLCQK